MVGSNKLPLKIVGTLLYIFLLAPIVIVIPLSFSNDQWLTFPPQTWGVRWYEQILGNTAMLDAFRTSISLAAINTVIALILGIPAAYALKRSAMRGADALLNFFTSPLLLPSIVLGLGILLVFAPAKLLGTYEGLLLAHLIVTTPYVVRILSTSLGAMNQNAEEAAATLGATPLRVFFEVTLPMMTPGLIASAALSFLVSFDEAVISLFLVGPRLSTLPVTLFSYVESHSDPMGAAVSVLLIAITAAFVLLLERSIGLSKALGK